MQCILSYCFGKTLSSNRWCYCDMKEGNIKYQFPLKKGMEHFPRKRIKMPFVSIIRSNYVVDASSLDVTWFALSAPSWKALKKSTSWQITHGFILLLFCCVLEVVTTVATSLYHIVVPSKVSNSKVDTRFGFLRRNRLLAVTNLSWSLCRKLVKSWKNHA